VLRGKTVFVVGAGASTEADLPSGPKLKIAIAELLRSTIDSLGQLVLSEQNREFFAELVRLERFRDRNRLAAAAQQIVSGVAFASSIDTFLEVRKLDDDITLLAKASIVNVILAAERDSYLVGKGPSANKRLEPTAIDKTWYQEFAQLFFEKVEQERIRDELEKLTVIDFNYDRCFEQLFFHALSGLYNLSSDHALDLMQGLRVLHPYGSVGALHHPHKSLPFADFGADSRGKCLNLSEGIKTFAERVVDDALLAQIHIALMESDTVVFLGFAFHPQNLELISPGECKTRKKIFGTRLGMSGADMISVESQLRTTFRVEPFGWNPTVELVDVKCGTFLSQYRRTLSAF
jgi:hypothetical protein